MDEQRQPRPFPWSVLHRPYPRFTAGTPTRLVFSREGRQFSYCYRPGAEVSAPTKIYFPAEFMDRASVTVTGGAWQYGGPSEVLRIQNGPEAETVEVAIRF